MKKRLPLIIAFVAMVPLCIALFFVLNISDIPDNAIVEHLLQKQAPYSGTYLKSGPWDAELYKTFYTRAGSISFSTREEIKGAIIPHHLLAGHLDAFVFEILKKQSPSTIVLFGPDHFSRGLQPVSTASEYWKTPLGEVQIDLDIVEQVTELEFVQKQPPVLSEEHSIYGLVPFVAESLPKTKVVPLALRADISEEELSELKVALMDAVPKDTVFLASVDFSHYQTSPVAQFHDERTLDVIRSFDFERIDSLEIDSPASIRLLLELMESYGTQRIVHEEHSNAAELVGDPDAEDITSYYVPLFGEGEAEELNTVSMLHVGDMMLDRNVANAMGAAGLPAVLDTLAGTEGRFFKGMDIVAGNLEGPFVKYRIDTTKEIAFRFDPKLAPQLASYGFNLVTLANNHLYDMGTAGLPATVKTLAEVGIDSYGHPYRIVSSSLFYKEIDGVRFAFIGLNDTFNSLVEEQAIAMIEEAEAHADKTVLNIHWGVEYKPTSHTRQQYLAHTFIDAGVDLLIGHHPHVVQELEIYKDVPIFYSLGNFLFDQYFSVPTQQSLAVGTVFHDDGLSLYLIPLVGERSVVRQMNKVEKRQFLAEYIDKSELGPYTFDADAHRIIIPISS